MHRSPGYLAASFSATGGTALSGTFGPQTNETTGVQDLDSLVVTLAGGTTPVTVTISGLSLTNTLDASTPGQLSFVLPANTTLPLAWGQALAGNGPKLTLSSSSLASGQMLGVVLAGPYR